MAKKQSSRAQDAGVSTKKLRRMAAIRIERMRRTVMAIEQAWVDLEDTVLADIFREIDEAIDQFEMELSQVAEYQDQPVGSID